MPWLCAYSGTRVGEMAQLRKLDIKQEGGFWIITIAHEAVTQKRKATWDIPLHPHLVEMGFLEFVKGQWPAGQNDPAPALCGLCMLPMWRGVQMHFYRGATGLISGLLLLPLGVFLAGNEILAEGPPQPWFCRAY